MQNMKQLRLKKKSVQHILTNLSVVYSLSYTHILKRFTIRVTGKRLYSIILYFFVKNRFLGKDKSMRISLLN